VHPAGVVDFLTRETACSGLRQSVSTPPLHTPMPSTVHLRDLHKRYGGVHAVRGVSFAVERGEIFGLLGPNGAGKTTTVECLIGLRTPDSGEIDVCGVDARRDPAEVKQRIGVALQSTSLQDQITPAEALRLFGSFYRRRAEPKALLARFGLEGKADARFSTLSGGQRQRLALALAFVNQPEVVLLDEPTTGLDPQARRELHADIAGMKSDGTTVLLTTHYLEEAEQLCDRIAIINEGRIVATGTPRELIAQSSHVQTVRLVTVQPLARSLLAQLPGAEELACAENIATFRTRRPNETLAAVSQLLVGQRAELLELHVRKATLEDVFVALTTGDGKTNPEGGKA
jgi:ABC-2 type transport system ATP-binding protein